MAIHVYVSSDPAVSFGGSWEQVGTLDASEPTINTRAATALRKSSGGNATLRVDFYLSGDPASRWIMTAVDHTPFGVAFDLLGDMSRVLVARKPAKVTPLRVRPPEPHPGLLVRPIMIPIRVSGGVTRI